MTPPLARAEIIAVGSELLALGRTDTNSGVIAERLARLGIDVVARSVVGDNLAALELAVRTALQRADLIITTGGLGPTEDDLTRQAVADALGRGLWEDAEVVRAIEARFSARGLTMPDVNRRQAQIIDAGIRLDNPNGTAPGQWIDVGTQVLVLLPGPPREMVPMLDTLVSGRLAGRAGLARTYRRTLKLVGRSESAVEAALMPFYPVWRERTPSIDPTILAALGRIELHLFARDTDADAAGAALERARDEAAAVLGTSVYTMGDASLEDVVGRLLSAAGWRVAVAESCTGGLLGAHLTDIAGSSSWVEGGAIVYSNALKTTLAGVPASLIEEHGAVSEPVARALAAGIRERCGADVGIGITGIAGPGGGSDAKPVGTVHFAIHTPTMQASRQSLFIGDRVMVRQLAVTTALDMLRLALQELDPTGQAR